jgi:hypothetical protein
VRATPQPVKPPCLESVCSQLDRDHVVPSVAGQKRAALKHHRNKFKDIARALQRHLKRNGLKCVPIGKQLLTAAAKAAAAATTAAGVAALLAAKAKAVAKAAAKAKAVAQSAAKAAAIAAQGKAPPAGKPPKAGPKGRGTAASTSTPAAAVAAVAAPAKTKAAGSKSPMPKAPPAAVAAVAAPSKAKAAGSKSSMPKAPSSAAAAAAAAPATTKAGGSKAKAVATAAVAAPATTEAAGSKSLMPTASADAALPANSADSVAGIDEWRLRFPKIAPESLACLATLPLETLPQAAGKGKHNYTIRDAAGDCVCEVQLFSRAFRMNKSLEPWEGSPNIPFRGNPVEAWASFKAKCGWVAHTT